MMTLNIRMLRFEQVSAVNQAFDGAVYHRVSAPRTSMDCPDLEVLPEFQHKGVA